MSRRPLLVLLAAMLAALAAALLWWRGTADAPASPPDATVPATANGRPTAAATATPTAATTSITADDARAALPLLSHGVRGRLVDAGGEPVAGAAMLAFPAAVPDPFALRDRQLRGHREPALAAATTDADGRFALQLPDALGAVRTRLIALAADTPRRRPALPDGEFPGPATPPGEWAVLGELRLPTATTLRGIVLADDDGTGPSPIAGAVVTVFLPGHDGLRLPGRDDGRIARTDADGGYAIDGLAPGMCRVTAAADGRAAVELVQQHLFAGEDNQLDFALPRGRDHRGVVVDGRGRGIADALVRAMPVPGTGAVVTARSGDGGAFVLTGLAPVDLRVSAAADGYQATVQTLASGDARQLRLVLDDQATLGLSVRTADGEPVAAYDAALRPAGAGPHRRWLGPQGVRPDTAPAGVFDWRGIDPGEWVAVVKAPGSARSESTPFAVAAGERREVTVTLRAGGCIRGRVTDANGRPLAAAAVVAERPGRLGGDLGTLAAALEPLPIVVGTRTDADGAFALRQLAAGDYAVRVQHGSAAPTARAAALPTDGADVDLGAIALSPASRVVGRAVVGDAIDAQVFVQLQLLAGDQLPAGWVAEAPVAADGGFAFGPLPAGRWALCAGRRRADNPVLENVDRSRTRVEFDLGTGDQHTQLLRIDGQ